ncbi:Pantoate--beta-alanine ligase [Ceratobasidium theobromae]|uniref:Pantoate--beta-alanine ligase n=1 Tax=Ceratobasidium theobromae TaxID=1582974 RepID=A0A5N5QL26_9AGAM|nr:Pantoate--beta-alanine ligase [Ceratobasidium theobromae]
MNALRLCRSLSFYRVGRLAPCRFASTLPGYPTPGTAFSPPPAPSRATEDAPSTASQGKKSTANIPKDSALKTGLPESDIPIFTSLDELQSWRNKAFVQGKSVGFVPTMGALHEGHIALVRESLKENDLTVVSIYVNPAQFAPHEDLSTYPRTLESDMRLLAATKLRAPLAVFLPTTAELYPSGISHAEQLGTYVVPAPSLASQMEGKSRPTFFRGVATVVTKLLNAVLPSRVYFGQKDIQQALIMRGMVRDLCMSARVRIVKTVREHAGDGVDLLALSSRNAYLTPGERVVAPTLRRALGAVEAAWYAGAGRSAALASGRGVVDEAIRQAPGVEMRLDYMEMNDPKTFQVISDTLRSGALNGAQGNKGPTVILSGALWVGRTRLIDNILLGDAEWVFE